MPPAYMLGKTATNTILPLLVDATGKPIITGNVLGKNNDPILAYKDVIRDYLSNTNLPAGGSALLGSIVPAGQIWFIENAVLQYQGTVAGVQLYYEIRVPSFMDVPIQAWYTILTGAWYSCPTHVTIKEGERMIMYIANATAGDDAYFGYNGRIMSV